MALLHSWSLGSQPGDRPRDPGVDPLVNGLAEEVAALSGHPQQQDIERVLACLTERLGG